MHEALGEVSRGHSQGLGTWGVQGIEFRTAFSRGEKGESKSVKGH